MPVTLSLEQRMLITRIYEVYPRGHQREGRRRFKRVGLSLRKGSAKTEFLAWIAACELHPDAPVRTVNWVGDIPEGSGVADPYIPMVAYSEEQSEELGYGTLYVILSEGPLANDFDVGLERIVRKSGDGRAVALASAPDARDGARTTFNAFDETHRWVLPRLKEAYRTMQANIPKRKLADAWSLEVTTAPVPGEGSVAESTYEYARQVEAGKIEDARLFFFHRQAEAKDFDLETRDGLRSYVLEASGPTAEWSDIEGIVDLAMDPTMDRGYFRRVWGNELNVQATEKAFDVAKWDTLANRAHVVLGEARIALGFDGSWAEDATALVATEIASGYMWPIGIWEKPYDAVRWQVQRDEVDEAVQIAFSNWRVWRLYADPWGWQSELNAWAAKYGVDRVLQWDTRLPKQMVLAVQAFEAAIASGEVSHSGDEQLRSHIANTHRREVTLRDPQENPLFVLQKERKDSPFKIDAAMAAVLSWRARTDAVAQGIGPSVYETRGMHSV
jgi:phage terminase large subunit-like protein